MAVPLIVKTAHKESLLRLDELANIRFNPTYKLEVSMRTTQQPPASWAAYAFAPDTGWNPMALATLSATMNPVPPWEWRRR